MNKFEDDDLSELPVSRKTAVTTATPTATVTKSAVAELDDEGVDLVANAKELKAKPSLPPVLPKEQNVTTRFAIIPDIKGRVGNTHYLPTVGKGMTVLCVGEGCVECARGSDHGSRRKIVALALKYQTTNDGKFPANTSVPEISIGYINLSPSAFTELNAAPSEDENETIYSIDFRATKKSNGIGWVFSRAGKPAYIKAGLESAVKELAAPYADGKTLKSRLGKTVSNAELRAMIMGGPLQDTAATLADLEGIESFS